LAVFRARKPITSSSLVGASVAIPLIVSQSKTRKRQTTQLSAVPDIVTLQQNRRTAQTRGGFILSYYIYVIVFRLFYSYISLVFVFKHAEVLYGQVTILSICYLGKHVLDDVKNAWVASVFQHVKHTLTIFQYVWHLVPR